MAAMGVSRLAQLVPSSSAASQPRPCGCAVPVPARAPACALLPTARAWTTERSVDSQPSTSSRNVIAAAGRRQGPSSPSGPATPSAGGSAGPAAPSHGLVGVLPFDEVSSFDTNLFGALRRNGMTLQDGFREASRHAAVALGCWHGIRWRLRHGSRCCCRPPAHHRNNNAPGARSIDTLHKWLPIQASYVEVGRVTGAHGVRGELRVEPSTDQPAKRFKAGSK